MGFDKKNLLVTFDVGVLLELKKALFRHGLTAHQFFGHIAELTSLNDERIVSILKEAQDYKKQRVIEGKINKIDAETMYNLIEELNNSNLSNLKKEMDGVKEDENNIE